MSRLIDADELKSRTTDYDEEGCRIWHEWDIDNTPTVITNSVYEAYCALSDEEFEHSNSFWITTPKGKKFKFVKERPHGEWTYGEDECGQDGWFCSECGFFVPWYYEYYENDIDFIREYKACPHCLAEMVTYTGKDRDKKGGAKDE